MNPRRMNQELQEYCISAYFNEKYNIPQQVISRAIDEIDSKLSFSENCWGLLSKYISFSRNEEEKMKFDKKGPCLEELMDIRI